MPDSGPSSTTPRVPPSLPPAPDAGGAPVDDLYRASIDASPYGIRVVEPDGRIVLFNRRLEQITGYTADEIPDITTWMAKLYPNPAYRELNAFIRDEFRRGADFYSPNIENRQIMLTRKDGRIRMCSVTISKMPVRSRARVHPGSPGGRTGSRFDGRSAPGAGRALSALQLGGRACGPVRALRVQPRGGEMGPAAT